MYRKKIYTLSFLENNKLRGPNKLWGEGVRRNLGIKPGTAKTVSDIEEHRLILAKKKLCFTCTRTKHQASECLSII